MAAISEHSAGGHPETSPAKIAKLMISLLGTGAAERVPSPACRCATCAEARRDPRLRRRHAKALVTLGATRVLIDCGGDIDTADLPRIDAVLLTHFHFDHVLGLGRLVRSLDRARRLSLFHAPAQGWWGTRGILPAVSGGARLTREVLRPLRPLRIGDLEITPVPLSHGTPCYGYLFEGAGARIAYLTDTRGIPGETAEFLAADPLHVAAVDCTFAAGATRQDQHNDLAAAAAALDRLRPNVGLLTHISHRNWPYALLRAKAAAAGPRWLAGVDGTVVEACGSRIRLDHPLEGASAWHAGPAPEPVTFLHAAP